jgi:hypothetical protein
MHAQKHAHEMYESENFDLSLSIPRRTPGQGCVGPSVRICHRTAAAFPNMVTELTLNQIK